MANTRKNPKSPPAKKRAFVSPCSLPSGKKKGPKPRSTVEADAAKGVAAALAAEAITCPKITKDIVQCNRMNARTFMPPKLVQNRRTGLGALIATSECFLGEDEIEASLDDYFKDQLTATEISMYMPKMKLEAKNWRSCVKTPNCIWSAPDTYMYLKQGQIVVTGFLSGFIVPFLVRIFIPNGEELKFGHKKRVIDLFYHTTDRTFDIVCAYIEFIIKFLDPTHDWNFMSYRPVMRLAAILKKDPGDFALRYRHRYVLHGVYSFEYIKTLFADRRVQRNIALEGLNVIQYFLMSMYFHDFAQKTIKTYNLMPQQMPDTAWWKDTAQKFLLKETNQN